MRCKVSQGCGGGLCRSVGRQRRGIYGCSRVVGEELGVYEWYC
jgi:hypothetical protein